MAMAACAPIVVCPVSSPLGNSGRFHRKRASSCARAMLSRGVVVGGVGGGESVIIISQRAGLDSSISSSSSSSASSSLCGRSSFHASCSRFSAAAPGGGGGASRGSRRNVVCEVAVKIGDAQEKEDTKEIVPGTKIKVTVPVPVYHVMKVPNLNIEGLEGEVKEVLGVYKGKPISANLPFKVQFFIDVEGSQVKFIAHLKDDEFKVIE